MMEEIRNLLEQGEEEMKSAGVLKENERYSASVFQAQQVSVLYLKSLYMQKIREQPFTHNIIKLVLCVPR